MSSTLMDYALPKTNRMPETLEVIPVEVPSESGSFGVRGVGRPARTGAAPGGGMRSAIVLGLLVVLSGAAGCAGPGAGLTPSAAVTTAVQGWEHYFRLEWAPQITPNGTLIDGYVHNTYGSPMGSVRLLAQALDRDNNVIEQKIEWVPGVVPNFSRSYFRISALPPADHYRVSVWSFDIIDTDDFMRFPRLRY